MKKTFPSAENFEIVTTSGDIVLNGLTYPTTDGTADQLLKTDGSGNLSWTSGTGGGLNNVVEDTTPQLGGDLDVNGNSIVSTTNGDITLAPNGTGKVVASNPLQLASYLVAGVPSASPAGQMIFVSDETDGATVAFSDGTNWRRVTDRAVIS